MISASSQHCREIRSLQEGAGFKEEMVKLNQKLLSLCLQHVKMEEEKAEVLLRTRAVASGVGISRVKQGQTSAAYDWAPWT